jgi:putative ABC transport system ATP-binding protein
MSDLVLQVSNLSKSYQSGAASLCVLKNVSLELAQQSTCAVIGPSGSGKTTFLGLCAGLDRPSSGSVVLCGDPLHEGDEESRATLRRERVGFVFQSFRLLATLTALENVLLPLELLHRPDAGRQAEELLDRVGLGERLHHYPSQLSGGEQQRVALARAFVHRPQILFADEPTGNLDAQTSAQVADLLFELHRESCTTLLLVTHDEELAHRTGRILTLRGGEVDSDELIEPGVATVP